MRARGFAIVVAIVEVAWAGTPVVDLAENGCNGDTCFAESPLSVSMLQDKLHHESWRSRDDADDASDDNDFTGDDAEFCEDLPAEKISQGLSCDQFQCDDYYDDDDYYYSTRKQACCACGGGLRDNRTCVTLSEKKRLGPVDILLGHCHTDTDSRGIQNVSKNKTMFIGDSDVEYWKTEKYFHGAENCGVGGGTAWELAAHAQSVAEEFTPLNFVVMISGENDFGYGGPDYCVDTVFADFKSAVEVFLTSQHAPTVILVGTKPEASTKALHPLYEKYDKLCKDLASERDGRVIFIDLYKKLIDLGNGKELYRDDGLHMSEKGYEILSEMVNEAMRESSSPASILQDKLHHEKADDASYDDTGAYYFNYYDDWSPF